MFLSIALSVQNRDGLCPFQLLLHGRCIIFADAHMDAWMESSVFGCRWHLQGHVSSGYDIWQTSSGGPEESEGGGWYRDRAGTACSVAVSSTKGISILAIHWRCSESTPCCDCITAAPPNAPLPHDKKPLHLTRAKHFGHLDSSPLPSLGSHDINDPP